MHNIFETFKELNRLDTETGTSYLKVSNNFVGGKTSKAGGIIEMGVDRETLLEISENKKTCLLLVVDMKEFERVKMNSIISKHMERKGIFQKLCAELDYANIQYDAFKDSNTDGNYWLGRVHLLETLVSEMQLKQK